MPLFACKETLLKTFQFRIPCTREGAKNWFLCWKSSPLISEICSLIEECPFSTETRTHLRKTLFRLNSPQLHVKCEVIPFAGNPMCSKLKKESFLENVKRNTKSLHDILSFFCISFNFSLFWKPWKPKIACPLTRVSRCSFRFRISFLRTASRGAEILSDPHLSGE